jgi:hypothetical protein
VKVINNRVATKEDVDAGQVVFFVPDGRSRPYSFGRLLPVEAKITKPKSNDEFYSPGTIVSIVQAELVDGAEVLLGVQATDDDEGLCSLKDVEVLND